MNSNIKTYTFFKKKYYVRKFSPLHYVIEIGGPFGVTFLAILAAYIWAFV